jgi:arginase
MASSEQLKRQTYQALNEGYYPIVLGGDHSQAIGSVAGMKRMYPNGKLIWIDAHIDANTPA